MLQFQIEPLGGSVSTLMNRPTVLTSLLLSAASGGRGTAPAGLARLFTVSGTMY